ncbi:MAG: hypothetical protein Q4G00_03225 [Clostridia bacterium]|nr:hypothetical protein [Clostridia bacterium]
MVYPSFLMVCPIHGKPIIKQREPACKSQSKNEAFHLLLKKHSAKEGKRKRILSFDFRLFYDRIGFADIL